VVSEQKASADAMELVVLSILNDSSSPVGASRLAAAWKAVGMKGAEATAGRYLRMLDERDLTTVSRTTRGRVLTAHGRARLRYLESELRQERHEEQIRSAVNASDIADLIDLLHMRRLVETEAASLAATRASDQELESIVESARGHAHVISEGGETTAPSMNFHRLVAEASHSRILIAVAHMLLDPVNDPLEKSLEAISIDVGETAVQLGDHWELAEALRHRNAERSHQIMLDHINRLIHAVEQYRDRSD
jgi:DNA-binding FadR family transcriptional regulator